MPSNYSFGLEILHYNPQVQPQKIVSRGGSYRSSTPKICIFKVIWDWKKPLPFVIIAPLDENETNNIIDNTTMDNVSASISTVDTTMSNGSTDNMTGEIIVPPIPDSDTRVIWIVLGVIVCGLIIVWFRMRKGKETKKRSFCNILEESLKIERRTELILLGVISGIFLVFGISLLKAGLFESYITIFNSITLIGFILIFIGYYIIFYNCEKIKLRELESDLKIQPPNRKRVKSKKKGKGLLDYFFD